MMANDYGIPCNSISAKIPKANTIVEWAHQTIGDIMLTSIIQEMELENDKL